MGGVASKRGDLTQQAVNSTGIDIGYLLSIVGGLSGSETSQRSGGIGVCWASSLEGNFTEKELSLKVGTKAVSTFFYLLR